MSRAPKVAGRPAKPASGSPRAASPGAKAAPALRWGEPEKHGAAQRWSAPDAGSPVPARISALQARGVEVYYCYRAGKYLGSATTIEAARAKVETSTMSERPYHEAIGDTGFPAFLALTGDEQVAFRSGSDDIPPKLRAIIEKQRENAMRGLPANAGDLAGRGTDPENHAESAKAAEKAAKKHEKVLARAGVGMVAAETAAEQLSKETEMAFTARDVTAAGQGRKFPAGRLDDVKAAVREHVEKHGLAPAPAKGERAGKKGASIPDDGTIRMLTKDNPRKPGSGAHARFEVLRKFDGKKVAAYRAAGGNMETLDNAVAAGRAKVE